MALTPATNKQVPEHSILDYFNKQCYLGNVYTFVLDAVEITAGTEVPFVLLSNPVTPSAVGAFPNGKALFQDYKSILCLTQGQSAILRFYTGPTVTSPGTPGVPINLRPASLNTSIAAVSTNPTTSSFGSLIGFLSSTDFSPDFSNRLSIIDPGQSLLVTVATTSNTTFVSSKLSWYEL